MQHCKGPSDVSVLDSSRDGSCPGPKSLLRSTAKKLKGSLRRLFMAETVQQYGHGGQSRAESELGWNRGTIRKGAHELKTGIECKDGFLLRGRKSCEERLPNLSDDIRELVDPKAQTEATFRTSDLFVKVTAKEVRQMLIEEKGYEEGVLPKRRTINTFLNRMGYRLRTVKKTDR